MLPRNKLWGFVALSLFFLGLSQAWAGDGRAEQKSSKNAFVQFYQDHLSAADGARCPMTPSCSEYAAQAIKKHGAVMGWIMASDRLVRCGRDEVKLAPHVRIKGYDYAYDPVIANDFWWFSKEENQEKTP